MLDKTKLKTEAEKKQLQRERSLKYYYENQAKQLETIKQNNKKIKAEKEFIKEKIKTMDLNGSVDSIICDDKIKENQLRTAFLKVQQRHLKRKEKQDNILKIQEIRKRIYSEVGARYHVQGRLSKEEMEKKRIAEELILKELQEL